MQVCDLIGMLGKVGDKTGEVVVVNTCGNEQEQYEINYAIIDLETDKVELLFDGDC